MKKTMMFLGMLSLGLAQAQQGNVGINTDEPKATLEIKPTATNLAGTTNEGIVAPKLSKTRVAAITAPVEGTLVYVTDEAASTIASYTGSDVKVAKIDEKGYYFFDGTEWVKTSNEWIYQPDKNRIFLKRSGKGIVKPDGTSEGMFNQVYYDETNGRFINSDGDMVFRHSFGNEDTESKVVGGGSTYNVSHTKADKILYNDGLSFHYSSKDENFLEVNDKGAQIAKGGKHFSNQKNYTYSSPTSTENIGTLLGIFNYAIHRGSGRITNGVVGNANIGILKNGGAAILQGSYNSTILHTESQVNNIVANSNFNTLGKPGITIDIIGNIDAIRAYNEFKAPAKNKLKNINSAHLYNLYDANGASLNIEHLAGLRYDGFLRNNTSYSGTIDNHYGVYIDNITNGVNNYAIYTQSGQVRFGDNVGILVDNPKEKLEVAGAIKVANSTDDTCNSTKAGTIRFVAGTKKFQGCTGTDWVDLH